MGLVPDRQDPNDMNNEIFPSFLPGETFLATGQGLVSPLLRKWSLNSGDTKVIGVSRTEYQRGEILPLSRNLELRNSMEDPD